jgi:hypothetical protein
MKIRQHHFHLQLKPYLDPAIFCLYDFLLPFDFSGIKLSLSFKLILRNVFLYKQPNVTMTPEHIMETRSTQSKYFKTSFWI